MIYTGHIRIAILNSDETVEKYILRVPRDNFSRDKGQSLMVVKYNKKWYAVHLLFDFGPVVLSPVTPDHRLFRYMYGGGTPKRPLLGYILKDEPLEIGYGGL